MSIDFQAVRNAIKRRLSDRNPISVDLQSVIESCELSNPHRDWTEFRNLRYDDYRDMFAWLCRVFQQDPPKAKLTGLWFGMNNPLYDHEVVADIYVSGCAEFSDDESDLEWACDPVYLPRIANAHSPIMAQVYRLAYGRQNGLGNDAEYPLCLAYGVFLIRRLIDEIDPTLILGRGELLNVAVGFDSGDGLVVGKLTADGFQVRVG